MAGMMVETVTEYGSTILRLVHDGKIIDRMEVDDIIFCGDENDFMLNENVECNKLWEEKNV